MSEIYSPPFDLKFFALGVQKSASSWLYYCLEDHPAIALPKTKMEDAYVGSATFREKGAPWYFDRFADQSGSKVYGEVAVDYIMDSSAPRAIRDYSTDPKFILLIRDPVDRLVSGYFWSVRRRQLANRPIEVGIASFLDQPPGFPGLDPSSTSDQLAMRGFYGDLLEPYLAEFPPSRFLVIAHEEILEDPRGVMNRVYGHIGVDAAFRPKSLGRQPKKNSHSRLLIAMERLTKGWSMGYVTERGHRVLNKIRKVEPPLSAESRSVLRNKFRPRSEKTLAVLADLPKAQRPPTAILKSWI